MTDLERIILKLSSREQLDAVEIAKATVAIRAHMEAMKQEPRYYLVETDIPVGLYKNMAFAQEVIREGYPTARIVNLYTVPLPVERDLAYREALRLAKALHKIHYWEVTQWQPLEDLVGLITQIDNMVADLVKPVLKVPALDHEYYRNVYEKIITMNPHLKVEEVK